MNSKKSGFTLLELMLVLVVMGFLIWMITPRLGGLLGNAIDTVCDTNNKGVRYFTRIYQQEHGRLPSKLTTLCNYDSTGGAMMAEIDNRVPDDEPESLCWELIMRNKFYPHVLDAAEASELKQLGVAQVCYLNDPVGSHDQTFNGLPLEPTDVEAGVMVLMVGAGHNGTNWVQGMSDNFATYSTQVPSSAFPASTGADTTLNGDHGNPYWMYRIALGVGEKCSLVTDGVLQSAALCPGGLQNSDNVVFNNYTLILPRLESTIARLSSGDPAEITCTADTGEVRVYDLTEAQEAWAFDATCPEGHKWPDNETEMWSVVVSGSIP